MTDAPLFAAWRAAAALRHPALHRRVLHRISRWPDAALPRRHADRVFRRKPFDHDPRVVTLNDKLAVRGWWAEDIPPDLIRPGVAIEANHGSGSRGRSVTRHRRAPLPPDTPLPAARPRTIAIAERLSRGFDLRRFGLPWAGGRLWGGEITVVPAAGCRAPSSPCDALMEQAQDLRRCRFLRQGASCDGWLTRAWATALMRAQGG